MLFGSCKDKNRVLRRLLKGLKKGIKRRLREHVHLVDDKYRVTTHLRDNSHLLNKCSNILNRVVRRCIQLVNIQRATLIKCTTRVTLIARLCPYRGKTVNRLSKDTRTSGFTYTSRTTEEIGMRQLISLNGILEGRCNMLLPYHRRKGRWTILSC